MRPAALRSLATLALLLAASACKVDPIEPKDAYYLGYIPDIGTDQQAITVPTDVQAGQPFTVTMKTVWKNGCMKKGEVDMLVEGNYAIMSPWDRLPADLTGCTDGTKEFTHTAEVTFPTAGEGKVYVRGRHPDTDELKTVEFTLTVH